MIKLVKLITGEEVICDITVEETHALLKKPYKFMMTAEGLGSIPLIPFSKDEIYKISLNHIMIISEPEDDFLNAYNSQHGSGIVVAKNSILFNE
jgi:hypothetical protein